MTIEKKMFDFAKWLVVGSILLAILTSCSPYMPAAATATPTPAPSVTATAQPVKVQVTPSPATQVCTVTGTVYLRPDPSRLHAPLATLRAGQILEVMERGAWLKVSTRNKTGFIYSKFCQE